MSDPLRLLLVEDEPDDAALLLRQLRQAGYDVVHDQVQSAADLRTALTRDAWDLVVSDFSMPGFTGLDALRVLRETGLDVPFIMVSGTIGEETAVEAMRAGASDYVMKGRLARLAPAVKRELKDVAERRARRRAEKAVEWRDAILKAVVGAAEQLLRSADLETTIPGVLERLGSAVDVSRAYVVELRAGGSADLVAGRSYEWCAPGVAHPPGDSLLEALPVRETELERAAADLRAGRPVLGYASEDAQGDRPVPHEARSFACVPVFVGMEWWGTIGFEDRRAGREWSPAELDALKTVADTLGAALQRRRVEQEVQRQLQRVASLRAINLAMNASLDLGVTLDVLLEHATSQLRVDAADVLLLRPWTQVLELAAARGFLESVPRAAVPVDQSPAAQAVLGRRSFGVSDLSAELDLRARLPFLRDEFVAYFALPLVAKGEVQGVLELFHRSPLAPASEWLEFAHTLAGQAAAAIEKAMLFEDLQRSHRELVLAYDTTLEGWSRALDLRDRDTEGHTQRVTDLVLQLGRELGMSDAQLLHVRRGALLHDIGKMGIPDGILLKPGPLTDAEWSVMRQHPVYAYQWLVTIPYLAAALDIPYCHHERWDGTGYPRGLRGEEIPLGARAFAVVDIWDALRSDRPYRQAWPDARARAYLRSLAGRHLDPRLVQVFLERIVPAAEQAATGEEESRSHGGGSAPPVAGSSAARPRIAAASNPAWSRPIFPDVSGQPGAAGPSPDLTSTQVLPLLPGASSG